MNRFYTIVVAILSVGFLVALGGGIPELAQADPTESTLYTFQGKADGGSPYGGLSVGIDGSLYGTTVDGTTGQNPKNNFGTVFRLTTSGVKTILHTFDGTDGSGPQAGVLSELNGVLYGVTTEGGSTACTGGCGVVYKLFPNGQGGYAEQVIYAFQGGSDGFDPISPLVMYKGSLYGTTAQGGNDACPAPPNLVGCGTAFQLSPVAGGWTKRTLYAFSGGPNDGAGPRGGLTVNSDGVYGTTDGGGNSALWCDANGGCGTVFLLTPTASGPYTELVLYKFRGGADGFAPRSALFIRKDSKLIGLTTLGGIGTGPTASDIGNGVVYSLTPQRPEYMERTLYSFMGLANGNSDGWDPIDENGMSEDASGDLYGTTFHGGDACDCGTVFELTPSGSGYNESVLYRFPSTGPYGPRAAPLIYPGILHPGFSPQLFGTTLIGGVTSKTCQTACGGVYKVTP